MLACLEASMCLTNLFDALCRCKISIFKRSDSTIHTIPNRDWGLGQNSFNIDKCGHTFTCGPYCLPRSIDHHLCLYFGTEISDACMIVFLTIYLVRYGLINIWNQSNQIIIDILFILPGTAIVAFVICFIWQILSHKMTTLTDLLKFSHSELCFLFGASTVSNWE